MIPASLGDGYADIYVHAGKHPRLRVLDRWMEDARTHCSNTSPLLYVPCCSSWPPLHAHFTLASPVVNVLSDDPTAEWRADGAGRHWCIFVFPNMYSITSIALTLR